MAEVKNAFIKSKMNRDLDSRLIPSGEYRSAINAQVSKSEGADVGALENVLGNMLLKDFEPSIANLSSIGYLVNEFNSTIYVFLTDNAGSDYNATGVGSNHFIYSYDTNNPNPATAATKLVSGSFLNFSKLYPIYGVNLLENLLFFTDNNNQPRRINVIDATSSNYYTTEDQISVATYNPYESIELYEASAAAAGFSESTMKDVVNKFLPNGGTTISGVEANPASIALQTDVTKLSMNIFPNVPVVDQRVSKLVGGVATFLGKVSGYNPVSGQINLDTAVSVPAGTEIIISVNPYYDSTYNGDPRFLEDKFVRFSYRFKFKNGEYSIMAPFTQPCFIPKQDGYFLMDNITDGDETQAVDSTIIDFMENKVNRIGLVIPLPSAANALENLFHVDEIDIVYKESDGLAIQVVESVPISIIDNSGTDTFYKYVYQSIKPYKTLPSNDTTRVYDKVPVKALGQEVISNRVVYANFQDKHTPPPSLNYNIAATNKAAFNLNTGVGTTKIASSTIDLELKLASGTIQIGSIVSGFASQAASGDVIVASTTGGANAVLTLNIAVTVAVDVVLSFRLNGTESNTTSLVEYPNSSLKTNRNYQVGVVLSDKFGRQSTTILSDSTQSVTLPDGTSYVGSTLYSSYIDEGQNVPSWPGNSLKILFNDPIGPTSKSGTEPGIYNGDSSSSDYNPLGWYSYKIVVKQTEQEYYNVYTSGALKGLPTSIAGLPANTSSIVLINDNINKIPRDLSEVGPQDKTFRSSVRLFGRVQNTRSGTNPIVSKNSQFYPSTTAFTTSTIESLFSSYDLVTSEPAEDPALSGSPYHVFFKGVSNPFIAEIITSQIPAFQFGEANSGSNATPPLFATIKTLAVFETEPVVSRLDIFWETTSSGLITNLNDLINSSSNAGGGFSTFNSSNFKESIAAGDNVINSNFRLINNLGANIPASEISNFEMLSVFNRQDPPQQVFGTGVSNPYFTFGASPAGSETYNVKVTSDFINNIYYSSDPALRSFDFNFTSSTVAAAGSSAVVTNFAKQAVLKNENPVISSQGGAGGGNFSVFAGVNQTTAITNLTATNGAYAPNPSVNPNPNRGQGLIWSIVDVTTEADVATSLLDQSYFNVVFSNTAVLSSCDLKLNPNLTSIPATSYRVTIKVTDDGGAVDDIVVTVNLAAVISNVQTPNSPSRPRNCVRRAIEDPGTQFEESFYYHYVTLEVTNGTFANRRGFYLYYVGFPVNSQSGTNGWSVLQNDTDSSGNIQIDFTGATQAPDGACQTNRWYFGATKAILEAKLAGCVIPQSYQLITPSSSDITTPPISNYVFAVV